MGRGGVSQVSLVTSTKVPVVPLGSVGGGAFSSSGKTGGSGLSGSASGGSSRGGSLLKSGGGGGMSVGGVGGSSSGSSSSSSSSSSAGTFINAELLDRLIPVEQPVYILLTDQKLYLFSPLFTFPYFSKDASDPYAQYIQHAMKQVKYDDPRKYLTLLYEIPFGRIGRVDVGPNRQYLGIHFLVGEGGPEGSTNSVAGGGDATAAVNQMQGSGGTGSTSSLSGPTSGSTTGGSNTTASGRTNPIHHNQTPFASLVLLTRDRTTTTRILDNLMPLLYESEGELARRIKGPDGRVRIVNQDVEWAMRGVKERVLLRRGIDDFGVH
ncbi:hypothetical protein HK102_011079, partial [Quaeritorhiza haematococci]